MMQFKNKRFRGNTLDQIYVVPVQGPADERYFHTDITTMGAMDRCREYERARHRLLLDPKPHPWLIQRCGLLRRSFNDADQ